MAQDLSQAELERMVQGKPVDPTITFFEQAILDPEESKKQGRRIYINRLMIKRVIPGVDDYVAQRARPEDVRRWPEEYNAFKTQVQERKSPGLEVIPGIDNIERQELVDRGYGTIRRLAQAVDVPEHLKHVQASAVRLHHAFEEEQHHGEVQESHSEEEASTESTENLGVLEGDRQVHDPVIEGREDPRVQEARDRPAEGNGQDRRFNGNSEIDNWNVDMVWRP